jgi:hypothetical protein
MLSSYKEVSIYPEIGESKNTRISERWRQAALQWPIQTVESWPWFGFKDAIKALMKLELKVFAHPRGSAENRSLF